MDREAKTYAAVQFVQVLGLSLVFIALFAELTTAQLTVLAAEVTWGLASVGALFDGRPWAGRSEWVRLSTLVLAPVALLPGTTGLALALAFALNLPFAWHLGVRWRGGTPLEGRAGSGGGGVRAA
jgi:hypothetical protein